MIRETGLCRVVLRAEVFRRFLNTCSAVQRFANEVVKPRVREMDENERMDPDIIKGLFEQGVWRY